MDSSITVEIMIIHFDVTVDHLSAIDTDELYELIPELIRCSVKAYHYLVMNRACVDWLLQELTLTPGQISRLHLIKNQYPTRAALLREANIHLKVSLGEAGLTRCADSNFTIGHKALLKTNILDKTILIVENSHNDGKFYKEIFFAIKKYHAVKTFDFEIQGGGGSTILQTFEDRLNDKKAIVLIADSDKRCPTYPISPTYKSIKSLHDKTCYLGTANELPCRDAENLIPLEVIQDHSLCEKNVIPTLVLLKSIRRPYIMNVIDDCPLTYFDMKEGVKIDKINNVEATKAIEKDWIHSIFKNTDDDDLSSDIPGFGPNLLPSLLRKGEAISALAKSIQEEHWDKRYGLFFKKYMWFIASEQRLAT